VNSDIAHDFPRSGGEEGQDRPSPMNVRSTHDHDACRGMTKSRSARACQMHLGLKVVPARHTVRIRPEPLIFPVCYSLCMSCGPKKNMGQDENVTTPLAYRKVPNISDNKRDRMRGVVGSKKKEMLPEYLAARDWGERT